MPGRGSVSGNGGDQGDGPAQYHRLWGEFLCCSAYENVLFCRVMHRQEIIDTILSRPDLSGIAVYPISLLASTSALTERLLKDVKNGIRERGKKNSPDPAL